MKNDVLFLNSDCPERVSGESMEAYEIRCQAKADLRMQSAKIAFNRPPYYLTYKERNENANK